MEQLILFRTIQGIGAGGMQPIAITIVGDIFNIQERAKMQGVFGAVWAVAGLVGPLLGGIIVALLSWRWVFYVNVPFGTLSAFLLVGSLHESIEKKKPVLDLAGAAGLTTGVIALFIGTDGRAPGVLLPASAVPLPPPRTVTDAGRLYLEYARQARARLGDAERAVSAVRTAVDGPLRITAPPPVARRFLVDSLAEFRHLSPRVAFCGASSSSCARREPLGPARRRFAPPRPRFGRRVTAWPPSSPSLTAPGRGRRRARGSNRSSSRAANGPRPTSP